VTQADLSSAVVWLKPHRGCHAFGLSADVCAGVGSPIGQIRQTCSNGSVNCVTIISLFELHFMAHSPFGSDVIKDINMIPVVRRQLDHKAGWRYS
jgi:hypothetical protein